MKQAIGGRVRGAVQSETPTEVVVTLGSNTTSVPTDQIASIRYDAQSANFQLGEAREAAGQLAEAADYFKKAAADASGRPFPQQAALFREAHALGDLALVEPDWLKDARGKPDPRIGLEAMLQAIEVHRSGALRDASIDEHLSALAASEFGCGNAGLNRELLNCIGNPEIAQCRVHLRIDHVHAIQHESVGLRARPGHVKAAALLAGLRR